MCCNKVSKLEKRRKIFLMESVRLRPGARHPGAKIETGYRDS